MTRVHPGIFRCLLALSLAAAVGVRAGDEAPVYVEIDGFQFPVPDADAARRARANPAAAFAALEKAGQAAEPVSRSCPVVKQTAVNMMNGLSVTRDGRRVYVCSPECREAAEKDWAGTLAEIKASRPAQVFCPITGRPLASLDKPVEIVVEGFRFQVADQAAADKAEGDAAAAFAALAARGDAATPVSRACPVMGNLVKDTEYVQKDGRRILMCCRGCTARIERQWDAMLEKLRDQAEKGDPADLRGM